MKEVSDSVQITRKQLYKRVWKEPIVRLAKEFGISDVGLAKVCMKYDIPRPPRGYWAKLAARKKVRKIPLPRGEDVAIEFDVAFNRARRAEIGRETEAKAEQLKALAPVLEKAKAERHTLAEQFLRRADNAKINSHGLFELNRVGLPHVVISPDAAERVAEFLSMMAYSVVEFGIEIGRDTESKQLRFKRDGFEVAISVEERMEKTEREPTEEEKRRPSWTWDLKVERPSGKLTVEVDSVRHFGGRRRWTESKRRPIVELAPVIVSRIDELLAEFEEERKAEIQRQLERKEAEIHRFKEEQLRDHQNRLREVGAHRERTLSMAARLWSERGVILEFVDECERRWGSEMSTEQANWVAWARRVADQLDPFSLGYPDPTVDGPFDEDAVPLGGPYPNESASTPIPLNYLLSELKRLVSDSSRSNYYQRSYW